MNYDGWSTEDVRADILRRAEVGELPQADAISALNIMAEALLWREELDIMQVEKGVIDGVRSEPDATDRLVPESE